MRSIAGVVVGLLVTGLLSMGGAVPATAATVYEITGRWAEGTPDVIAKGEIATAEWRINVNDDAAAPGNAPVDNVTATFTATDGIFSGIPETCLTTGVDPASSISSDGTVLVCNVGTKDQGTSVVLQTTIEATGTSGSQLSANGEVIGDSATVTAIDIDNPFFMDLTWGTPTSGVAVNNATNTADMAFQWSLLLGAGSDAGPSSVTYTIQASTTNGAAFSVGPGACGPFTSGIANGHPWSGGTHPADQTGPFVGSCSLTQTGPSTFSLTLSGIDYSAVNAADKDSAGDAISPSVDVIATGQIMLRLNSASPSTTVITSNAPTYTSVAGDSVADDTSNNRSQKVSTTFGGLATVWVRGYTNSGGAQWDDTYRVAAGTEVRSAVVTGLGVVDNGVAPTNGRYGLCAVLDSKYVTYNDWSYTSDPAPIVVEYYVGSSPLVNGDSASYDPNAFTCNEGGADTGAAGWTTVEPADKSMVKAVRAQIPFSALDHSSNTAFHVDQTIKPDVAPGQDIWEWGSLRQNGGAWFRSTATPNTMTPDARYPYTSTGGRDILRVSALQPFVEKDADRTLAQPGSNVMYTLDYQITGRTPTGTADGFRIVDVLPVGMTYTSGSANPAPTITTDAEGRQVLTWTLNGVETDVMHSLTYQVDIDPGTEPGTTLTNSATASIGGVTTDASTFDVRIPSDGYTSIGKTADNPYIPNLDGSGDGTGSWTVTLRSFDPYPQAFTDTIDVLPYRGDGRGTEYSGDYTLTDVNVVAGATVYYTTEAPASLSDDPAHATNGSAGDPAGNTVGWTTTRPANPTGVRVIGPELAPGATQAFSLEIETDGAEPGDVFVNRAQARAEHTELVMRTSAPIEVANYYAASVKKYVQDASGEWHDANTVEDYPAYRLGDEVPYRIVVTNTGQGALENIEVSDSLFAEGAFTIEELASGESETHEYTITLEDQGGTVVNTASATSDTPPDAETPPTIPPDPAGIEVINYATAKSSDPASGETVNPGDTITYTITVAQEGSVPADAEFTDTLVDVADDAVYNGDATASIGTVTVDGDLISWSGTVPVGEVAVITYSVTVKDSAGLVEDGDYLLGNSVLSPGCEDECSTEHPVADYDVVKTAEPESGSSVAIGDTVEYTITVTQSGEAAYADASLVDDLAPVLDDAEWGDTLEADGGDAVFDPDTGLLTWSGDLAVGEVVTITYSVTVTGGGDSVLDNVVTSDGCAEESDCTTEHLAPRIVPSKSVDPASGTTVQALQALTYTLAFTNDGRAAGTIDYTDHLADILDDADLTTGPTSSAGSVTATLSGDTIAVTGPIAAGATVTVTYTVTVGYDGERGNDHLGNFLVLGDEEPPTECATDSDLCTENPIRTTEWSCTSYGYLFQTPSAGVHDMYQVDLVSGVSTQIGSTTRNVNAVGYNTLDDYMYGWQMDEPRSLVRISADGSLTSLGVPAGTPAPSFQVGDFDDAGHLLLHQGGNGTGAWAQIDLAPGSATYGQVLASGTATRPAGIGALPSDWAFIDGAYYGLANTSAGTGAARLVRFVPETNTYTIVAAVAGTQSTATYGAAYADASGNLYVSNNATGNIYRVNPTTGASILLSNGPVSSGNDGARCATAPIPTVTVMKTVEGRVLPTDQFTVGLTRGNGAVLDSATTAGTGTTVSTTDWPVSQGITYGVTDAMAAGSASALSAYTATVECTDTVTGETFPVGGTTAQWTFTVPGQSAYLCEVTNEPIRPMFTVSKSASVETAGPGDVVTYEVTLTNTGVVPFTEDTPASFSDDLSGVLDDATYNGDASDGAVVDGTDLTWSGLLAIGETKTITYSVTVDSPPAGDHILRNTVVPDENGECDPEDSCVTDTPIGELADWKTVEASESPVVAGTELTYTLHFENRGEATVEVDRVDDLSQVLDDGDVTIEPSSDGLAVTRNGSRIAITGSLEPGASTTVTYTVTLKADGDRGDDLAANFLLDPEDTPPTEPVCQPTDAEEPDCTVTPIGRLATGKSVEASSDPVVAGTTLTYTLTFDNQGEASVPVDYTDLLAGVLDDADVTSLPVSSDAALVVSPIIDGGLTVTGDLAAGQIVTVTYVVTVKGEADRGDDVATNFLVETGEEPPAECVEGDPNCTETPLPNVTPAKSVDPASGTGVKAGDVLTYTLTFTNEGQATGPIDYTDHLADVLDDADLTDGPTSSDPAVTAVTSGDTIDVTGTIEPGATITIEYSVTVRDDASRGDDHLGNFLVEGDDVPPAECEVGDPLCTENPVGSIATSKAVEASSDPVVTGTELTYTLTFTNDGQAPIDVSRIDDLTGVLDDATVTSQPVSSSDDLTTSEVTDGIITITGVVAAGETVTVTYVVTVNAEDARGDDTADNFLLNPGEEPPAECVEGDPNCTSTPLPNVDAVKSVDPASGSSVAAGDVLTYTLTFTNEGNATGAVDFTDHLADILDDATVTGGPTSSDAGVTATLDGETIAVTGTIAAGATVTVTYEVTVGADGERGDNLLGNFLVPGDEEPPTECVEGSALCTENPIGELADWKSVEASETPVAAGTELTYTLHFENRGEGSVDVNRIDFLTHVLDDADVTAEPVSDTLTVTRDGETITITGSLEPGEAATVVYTVTVKADGERGDDTAANFLVPNDDPENPPTPPTDPVCQPTDAEEPDCTTTPIGQLTTGKSVEASSDPIVPGTTLTYTLTFDNQSGAAVVVDHYDDLSSVLDDADVTGLPVSSDPALTVSPIIDGSLSISGELASGQTVTVTYVVTVKEEAERGDDVATNFLVPAGEEPPAECVEGDPNCTSTPLPNVDAAKSVDPASGSSVAAGDVLTYTLTFMNDGNATGLVDYTDHLADVLDDATITGVPTSSDAAVSAVLDGETIAVSGSLAAGATVTVTYQVTVGADGDRGNNDLANFLVPGDEEPPTECVEGSVLCTENPIGELHDWKSVEASETPVAAGTELTYTLHFENRGEGSIDVNRIDFLTQVLDDADVSAEPVSDTLTVTRDGEAITITGSLEPGQSATVAYTVTVKADGERGDDVAANFLVPNDDPENPPTPPTDPVCEPTDAQEPDCTTTPIGSYTAVKTVTPDETPIGVGTLLAYTLTFTNASEADAEVDETDTLTGVLDDATLVDAPVSGSDSLVVSDVTDGAFTIVGTLAAGETVTIVYTVSVNPESARGDNLAANTLLPTDGDDECTPERCTETPLPVITPAKDVDPADGSTVTAGDVLTYTLTFANDSETDGSIEYTDLLTDLLDDATVTGQPTSSSGDVTATLDGDAILIEGAIAAGETVTVTYQVTVLPNGERGDDIIGNVVIPEGEDPPGPDEECAEGDPLCTENPVGELHDWKTVEASETPVAAGTELTYTLHFENRGEGTVDVNSIDFLTHVLDDADVTAEPVSDTLTVTRDGETITITGSLGAGESATVVYTVTVKADELRGDDTASNFLVPNDPENPPTPPTDPVCQPTDAEEPDCTVTPIGRLDTSKSVSASSDPIEAGTLLAYTLTFDNQSDAAVVVDKVDDLAGVLDDATVTTEPVSSDAALTATRDGSTISVTGTVAAGQTITVTYVVTVNDESERGDNVADNFLLNTGEEPPAECAEDDPNCTVTPLPNVDSSKSVDPASGSTVLPGDELTYTLTLTNSGEAAGAVDRIDYLEGVLDDAALTDGPTVSDPSVTAVLDGTELVIGGTLQPGQTATVTYTLAVLPDAERGDDTLTNFLFDTDEEPPGPDTECEEGDCTENYVPRIVDSKSADPASGTPIAAGQEVTYTLTFRNDGTATGEVAKEDVLTDVLDDADLTAAPVASSPALTVSDLTDGRILITGSLEPGESATVTYSVTVRPFSEQGDHVLGNWLVLPGDPPGDPESCEPVAGEEADCTVHPIGEIAATKSVDPKTGTAVTQGQVLRYTLTFTNTGAGTATVDYTDHLGDVFDDATLTSGPSSDVESVELDLSGDTLTVGGSLDAGATATVTYDVTVMAYDRQGNHILDNFLGLSGSDPEESCIADNPLCTSNPVTPPPPLAVTGGELGMGAIALMILLLLGGVLAIETSRRRRLLLESAGTRDERGVS